jgi:uncharacterized RDD family membrane protein YckC
MTAEPATTAGPPPERLPEPFPEPFPEPPPTAGLVLPAVRPPVAYAGAVTRLAAYVVDLTVMSTLLTAGSAVVFYLVAVVTGHQLELSDNRDLASAGLAVWWVVYFAGSWATTGRTLGMTLFGLRVVRPDGTRASGKAALVRALTFPLSLLLFGLGFLGILFQDQRRALHDMLAGTAVIYTFGPLRSGP